MPGTDNPNTPQVFSGARARFKLDQVPIGYAGGVSGEETIQYEEIDVLDLLQVKEHVPVAYRCTLNSQIFRVIGESLKQKGVFPKLQDIITSVGMTADIENASPVNAGETVKSMQTFVGVKTAGHTFDVTARGIVSENVNFVAIKVFDESEI